MHITIYSVVAFVIVTEQYGNVKDSFKALIYVLSAVGQKAEQLTCGKTAAEVTKVFSYRPENQAT